MAEYFANAFNYSLLKIWGKTETWNVQLLVYRFLLWKIMKIFKKNFVEVFPNSKRKNSENLFWITPEIFFPFLLL